MTSPKAPIADHLRSWIGTWPPPRRGLHVVACAERELPGWDGAVRPLLGAVDRHGAGVIAVSPALVDAVAPLIDGRHANVLHDAAVTKAVGEVVAGAGATLGRGVLRWARSVSPKVENLGEWRRWDDPVVPAWLHPFGGEVLLALDEDGSYMAGVGVKRHDDTGHELSVVTDEAHRGKGLARRLVATAARRALTQVPVVTYLHAPDNAGSAHVADAVGFPDRGWGVLGVWGGEAAG